MRGQRHSTCVNAGPSSREKWNSAIRGGTDGRGHHAARVREGRTGTASPTPGTRKATNTSTSTNHRQTRRQRADEPSGSGWLPRDRTAEETMDARGQLADSAPEALRTGVRSTRGGEQNHPKRRDTGGKAVVRGGFTSSGERRAAREGERHAQLDPELQSYGRQRTAFNSRRKQQKGKD